MKHGKIMHGLLEKETDNVNAAIGTKPTLDGIEDELTFLEKTEFKIKHDKYSEK